MWSQKKRVLKCNWFFFTIFLILPLKIGINFISRNLKSFYWKKLCTNLTVYLNFVGAVNTLLTFQWTTGEIWLIFVLWFCRKGWKCEGQTDIQKMVVASQSETLEKLNNSSSPIVEAVSGRKDPSIIEHRASTQQVLVGDRDKSKQLLGDDFSVQTDQPRPFSISRHFSTNHAAMSRERIS